MKCIRLITVLTAFLISQNLSSQIGIKLGFHSFDLSNPKDILIDGQLLKFKEARLGFQGGLSGRVGLKVMYIESRFMFHSTKVEYNVIGDNGGLIDNIRSESFTNLDIPLLIGFDLLFLDAFLGPVAHLHIDSTSDIIDFAEYDAKFAAAEYGWRAGIGVSLGNIDLSLEYEGNFSSFGEHIIIGGEKFGFDSNPSRILVNLGFKIF